MSALLVFPDSQPHQREGCWKFRLTALGRERVRGGKGRGGRGVTILRDVHRAGVRCRVSVLSADWEFFFFFNSRGTLILKHGRDALYGNSTTVKSARGLCKCSIIDRAPAPAFTGEKEKNFKRSIGMRFISSCLRASPWAVARPPPPPCSDQKR